MKRRQPGFALVAAIILLVLLSALAAFVAALVSGQSANQNLERMTRVAELSAQAGLEWGAWQVMRNPPPPAAAPACPPTTTLNLPGSLGMVPVTVSCSSILAAPVTVYRIQAAASYGGTPASADYVERSRTALFSR